LVKKFKTTFQEKLCCIPIHDWELEHWALIYIKNKDGFYIDSLLEAGIKLQNESILMAFEKQKENIMEILSLFIPDLKFNLASSHS